VYHLTPNQLPVRGDLQTNTTYMTILKHYLISFIYDKKPREISWKKWFFFTRHKHYNYVKSNTQCQATKSNLYWADNVRRVTFQQLFCEAFHSCNALTMQMRIGIKQVPKFYGYENRNQTMNSSNCGYNRNQTSSQVDMKIHMG